jgi:hypothetical protein
LCTSWRRNLYVGPWQLFVSQIPLEGENNASGSDEEGEGTEELEMEGGGEEEMVQEETEESGSEYNTGTDHSDHGEMFSLQDSVDAISEGGTDSDVPAMESSLELGIGTAEGDGLSQENAMEASTGEHEANKEEERGEEPVLSKEPTTSEQ